jgi:hypothetical protein
MTARGRRAVVVAATTGVALYVGALVLLEGATRADARAEAERLGLDPADVMVAPLRGRLFTSEVEVVTDDAYVPGMHRWLRSPRIELDPGAAVPRVSGPAALDADTLASIVDEARRRSPASEYLVWSRYPYVRVTPDGDAWRVLFADARYDAPTAAGSLAGVEVSVPR